MSLKLKSKTLINYYGENSSEYLLKYHHYNVVLDNENDNEYKLLEEDIFKIRNYNKNDSIIYFSEIGDLLKVKNNTNIFNYLDDVYLRIRNNDEYLNFVNLNIDINLIIGINDIDNIKLKDNNVILQIETIKELSIHELVEYKKKYNINKILLGQMEYLTYDYKYLLDVLSRQFDIDKSNHYELEINNEVTNDIYSVDLYIDIVRKIEKIIEINKEDNKIDTMKSIFYYLAENIIYDEDGVDKTNIESQNLIGILFNNKTVCEGYSKLFKQVLSLFDIECLIVIGGDSKENGGHVWNQVKIDDKWYNVDISAQNYAFHNNKNWNMFLVSDNMCKYRSSSLFANKCHFNYYDENSK